MRLRLRLSAVGYVRGCVEVGLDLSTRLLGMASTTRGIQVGGMACSAESMYSVSFKRRERRRPRMKSPECTAVEMDSGVTSTPATHHSNISQEVSGFSTCGLCRIMCCVVLWCGGCRLSVECWIVAKPLNPLPSRAAGIGCFKTRNS